MNEQVETFELIGRTNSGSFCAVSHCTDINIVREFFVSKYPRFKGKARLYSVNGWYVGDGGFISVCAEAPRTLIGEYESAKEIYKV